MDIDDELTPERVRELFAVALDAEPSSAVTAETVLREVRAQAAARPARFGSGAWFREQLGSPALKWGGGLVAAAAVVGAVALVAPHVGSSTTSAGSADSGTPQSASMADSAAGAQLKELDGATAESLSSESAAVSALQAPEMAVASPDSAAAGESGDGSFGVQLNDDTASAAQGSPAYDGNPADAGGTDTSSGSSEAVGSARQACPLASLTAAEQQAVTDTLVRRGFVVDGADELCGAAGERGESVRLLAKDATLAIVLGPVDAAAQPGEASASQSADGSVSVTEHSATWTVTVTASPQAAVHVDTGMLTDLAKAVLAAAR